MLDTDYTGKNQNTTDDYLYADNFEYTNEEDVTVYNATTGKETTENYLVSRGNEPRYMLDTHGAWIVENGQLKQENDSSVNQWNAATLRPSSATGAGWITAPPLT